jgi:hypothetical protein
MIHLLYKAGEPAAGSPALIHAGPAAGLERTQP